MNVNGRSFLIAFPTIQTSHELRFFSNLCERVSRAGYDLEVIGAKRDSPCLRSLSPVNIAHLTRGSTPDTLLKGLLRAPEKALIGNGLSPLSSKLNVSLVESGAETKIFGRSPLGDFFWVERDIFFGESELFGFSPDVEGDRNTSDASTRQMFADLSTNLTGARAFGLTSALRQKASLAGRSSGRNYLLFLLDDTSHSGWGNQDLGPPWMDLYPQFPDPAEALHVFSAFADAKGLDFVVSPHPLDPQPRFVPDIKAFQTSSQSFENLLVGAKGVISGVSKVLWAAVALGKPIAALALNPIQGLIADHDKSADANLLLHRFAKDLERGYTIDVDVLQRGLHFAKETIWIRSDFNNAAASKLEEWISLGRKEPRTSEVSRAVWPEFSKDDRMAVDEAAIALEWVKLGHDTERVDRREAKPLVAVDVGAHAGSVTKKARSLGFHVVAFEPNPAMAEKFRDKHGADDAVLLSRLALSSGTEEIRAFYTSKVSRGISTLEPFHESHTQSHRVFTTSLKAFLPQWGIEYVDVLKVDTEGFDLFVLQGHDWSRVKPQVVVCEFENSKTQPLGYNADDLADFLVHRGYSVFVSEWHPIEKYGGNHAWRTLYPYGSKPITNSSWGNFVAFQGKVSALDVRSFFLAFVAGRESKPKADLELAKSFDATRSMRSYFKTSGRIAVGRILTYTKRAKRKRMF